MARAFAAAASWSRPRCRRTLVPKVSDAFERHGAVDLDAREAEWRAGGWTGGGATAAAAG